MPQRFSQHVIVGAGGAIAHTLVPELVRQNESVTLVSRRGSSMPGATAVAADATDPASLRAAIPEGSAVYLLVGLPYRRDVWRSTWPTLMETVIRVCSEKKRLPDVLRQRVHVRSRGRAHDGGHATPAYQ